MSDAFDKAAQTILRAGEENGGLTNRNLFDLIVAGHEEAVVTAAALEKKTEECYQDNRTALGRIASHLDSEAGTITRKMQASLAQHTRDPGAHARAPRRKDDPAAADFSSSPLSIIERRVWVMWGVAIFVAMTVANGLIMWGLDKFLHP